MWITLLVGITGIAGLAWLVCSLFRFTRRNKIERMEEDDRTDPPESIAAGIVQRDMEPRGTALTLREQLHLNRLKREANEMDWDGRKRVPGGAWTGGRLYRGDIAAKGSEPEEALDEMQVEGFMEEAPAYTSMLNEEPEERTEPASSYQEPAAVVDSPWITYQPPESASFTPYVEYKEPEEAVEFAQADTSTWGSQIDAGTANNNPEPWTQPETPSTPSKPNED
jgi:hypothetical protein